MKNLFNYSKFIFLNPPAPDKKDDEVPEGAKETDFVSPIPEGLVKDFLDRNQNRVNRVMEGGLSEEQVKRMIENALKKQNTGFNKQFKEISTQLETIQGALEEQKRKNEELSKNANINT